MKKIIKNVLVHSRILKPLKIFQKNKLVIFNYHRIRDEKSNYTFDEGVFGPDKFRFQQEMKWLKNETRILSEDELVEVVHSKKPRNELCSMVTFDDGYRDNFDVAFPILKTLKIPALFFIPTYQINERKVGWWDVVAYLFKKTNKTNFIFNGIQINISNKHSIIKDFNAILKNTDADLVTSFLKDLSVSLEVELPNKEIQCSELMTWDNIRYMSRNGMSVGTHTHDHSIMSRQEGSRLKKQIKKSIDILEFEINKKIKSISYPVGGYSHFNDESKNISEELGLQLGFSYLTGFNRMDHIDPFDIKRMAIQPQWGNLDLPLAFPSHFLRIQSH